MDERHEPRTGRVRIIGAEPVGDNGGPEEEPPPGELDDDAALPHWTEAPTGQVPAVLSGGDEDDSPWRAMPTPTWREEHSDWRAHEEAFDPSVLAATDDVPEEAGERQPWSFDLDPSAETAAVPTVPRGAHAAPKPEELFGDLSEPEPYEDDDHWRYDDPATARTYGGAGEPTGHPGTHDALVDTGEVEVEEVGDRWGTGDAGDRDRWGTGDDGFEDDDVADDEPSGPVRVTTAGTPRTEGVDAGRPAAGDFHEAEPEEAEEEPEAAPDDHRAERRGGPIKIGSRGIAGRRPLTSSRPPGAGPATGPAGAGPAGTGPAGAGPAGYGHRGARPAGEHAGGRNLPVAIASGVVLGGVALVCFAFGTVSSMVVATAVVGFAAIEGFAAFRKAGYHPATLLGLVAVVGLMVGVYNRGEAAEPLVLVLLVAFTLLWHLTRVDKGADPVRSTLSTLFVYAWVGVFGSYAALLLSPAVFADRHGIAYLLGAVITVVAYDVAALGVGSWVGHRPLSSISPNKTWEGLIGGTVVAIVVAVMLVHLIHPWTIGKAAALGVIVAVLAPIGDLAESLVKRHVGVKDMGRVLPGHGGLLDRIDGLLFVLPATYYLVRAFHLG